jgi:hypothetical protein
MMLWKNPLKVSKWRVRSAYLFMAAKSGGLKLLLLHRVLVQKCVVTDLENFIWNNLFQFSVYLVHVAVSGLAILEWYSRLFAIRPAVILAYKVHGSYGLIYMLVHGLRLAIGIHRDNELPCNIKKKRRPANNAI